MIHRLRGPMISIGLCVLGVPSEEQQIENKCAIGTHTLKSYCQSCASHKFGGKLDQTLSMATSPKPGKKR